MNELLECFINTYHYKNYKCRVFSDSLSVRLITDKEYTFILNSIKDKIKIISPIFLAYNSYCEKQLYNAIKLGCQQYLIFNSPYNTFSYRNKIKNLYVYEINKLEIISDKLKRLRENKIDLNNTSYIISNLYNFKKHVLLKSNYNSNKISFCNLIGIYNIFSINEFALFIEELSDIIYENSTIVFNYTNKYNLFELQKILEKNNFLIFENLNSNDINNNYLSIYNMFNPNDKMLVKENIHICMAIKKL